MYMEKRVSQKIKKDERTDSHVILAEKVVSKGKQDAHLWYWTSCFGCKLNQYKGKSQGILFINIKTDHVWWS